MEELEDVHDTKATAAACVRREALHTVQLLAHHSGEMGFTHEAHLLFDVAPDFQPCLEVRVLDVLVERLPASGESQTEEF